MDDMMMEYEEPCLLQEYGSSTIRPELSHSPRDFNSIRGPDLKRFFLGKNFTNSFVPKTYGRWWEEMTSHQEDFMPQNNESIVSHDFADFKFKTAVYPVHIAIFEAAKFVGSVIKIWGKSDDFKWRQLWNGTTQSQPDKPRVFSPRLQFCKYKIHMLRLELNCEHLNGRTEICGVLLFGTQQLLLPYPCFRMSSINSLLDKLGLINDNRADPCNLTPNVTSSTDLDNLTKGLNRVLSEYCILPKKLCVYNHPKELKSPASDEVSPQNGPNDGANDVFDGFPNEMLLLILKHLDLRSLIRCSQVNKRLNWIIRDPVLFTSLNLKTYWSCIDKMALRYLKPRCTYLQRLEISWSGCDVGLFPADIIDFLESCGSQLTHLRLNSCGAAIDDAVITTISTTCKNLEELGLRDCRPERQNVFTCLKFLQNLQRLDLHSATIDTVTLCDILENTSKLRHLNLGRLQSNPRMDRVAIALAKFCPQVETIDFSSCPNLTEIGITALARCCHLREIDFSWRFSLVANEWISSRCSYALSFLLTSCRSLEKIFLSGTPFFSCEHIVPLFLCKRIRQLDLGSGIYLKYSQRVNMCARILSSCPELQMIDVSGYDIEDAHLKTWRKLHPNVTIISKNTAICPF